MVDSSDDRPRMLFWGDGEEGKRGAVWGGRLRIAIISALPLLVISFALCEVRSLQQGFFTCHSVVL